jgi:peptidoglycan/LPS O-acetylase OafA/YrhL
MSRHLYALDFLRGMAALSVMIPHFFMYFGSNKYAEISGVAAVEVFFVLSGFVLAPQIIRYAERAEWPTARTFLIRRWMRTVPPYLVALAAVTILGGSFGSLDFVRYATYTQNLFAQSNGQDFFPVAWSLSVEEWFYVVFPALLVAFSARKTSRMILYAAAFILLTSALRSSFGDMATWGDSVRRVVVFRVDSIAYGFLLYLGLSKNKCSWHTTAPLALLLGAVVFLFVNIEIAEERAWARSMYPLASALFGCAVVATCAVYNEPISRILGSRLCSYLGRISYPLYLFHLAGLMLLTELYAAIGAGASLALYVSGMLAFSTIFHYGFEIPILAVRPRYQ